MAAEINNDCVSLNFPSDFTKKQTRVQYLYSMGAMRPMAVMMSGMNQHLP